MMIAESVKFMEKVERWFLSIHSDPQKKNGSPTDYLAVGDRKEWKSEEFFFRMAKEFIGCKRKKRKKRFFFLLKCFNCINFQLWIKQKREKEWKVLIWTCNCVISEIFSALSILLHVEQNNQIYFHRVLFQVSFHAHDSSFLPGFKKKVKKKGRNERKSGSVLGTASHL